MAIKKWNISYIATLLIVLLFSWFVVWQIEPQTFQLSAERITFEQFQQVPGGQCKETGICTILGKANGVDIDISNISDQLKSFDNFFPLSVITKLNIKIATYLDSNLNLEVTYPKYVEKITDIEIYCGDERSPKYDSKKTDAWIYGVREWAITNTISEHYKCQNANIRVSYHPTGKVVVGPNEYVKIVTSDNGLPALSISGLISVGPNLFTKFMIFIIVFFLTLGAGSLLLSFCENLRKRW